MTLKRERIKFRVPNYGAKRRSRVGARWRKQRGIDNKRRVKKQNRGPVPQIGYKNSDVVRFARPDGSFEMLVHNKKELMAVVGMPGYVARFAHDLSVRKRIDLQKTADEYKVRIVNKVQS